MEYIVYALYNSDVDKIYIGQTKNLEERVSMHASKFFKKSYTGRFRGSWEIFHQERFDTRNEAMKREKQLKSFRGREFLRNKLRRI